MQFTQEQIKTILAEIAKETDGFTTVMRLALESMMKAERAIHNTEQADVSNGFRSRRVYGRGKILELSVPRSRNGGFYPFLLSILKDQQQELNRIAFSLYSAGLTTAQIGEIFDQLYGSHYSKSNVSYMMEYAREEVAMWLDRQLESYYPIIYIDATFVYTRRDKSVSKEAYYTVLGVKKDMTREVLSVVNNPTESASVWQEIFEQLKSRGVKKVGLFVCDGLTSIENSIARAFPTAEIQLCVVHLQRNIINKVKSQNKRKVAEELKVVFNPKQLEISSEKAHENFTDFITRWAKIYPSFKGYLTPRYRLYFNYFNYDNTTVRQMIYTTNWIERLNRDYKRVLKIRGAMPSASSVLLLMGNVAKSKKAYHFPIHNFSDCSLFDNEF